MKTIGDVMTHGVAKLQTIDPASTVKQAVDLLNQHNIGALPVCDAGGRLVGIITERDVLRLCGSDGIAGLDTHMVSEVMTPSPLVGVPDDTVAYVMRIMTEHRIRHLPVMDGGRLVGITSIGDVVKAQLEETNAEVSYLREYVGG
jgi:CBS domain-containing protein